MRNAIHLNGNMQFGRQGAPFGTQQNRRAQDIGRLNTQIGLNTAHKFVPTAYAMDLTLYHIARA